MAALGKTNNLEVVRFTAIGAFLDAGELGEILLPKRVVPSRCSVGDMIDVFVYCDSRDRVIATTKTPLAEVGGLGSLKVVQVNTHGAFMSWGLEKDLFVPFGEQAREMNVGERHVVFLYIDNTDRISGSSKLTKFISDTARPDQFAVGEKVDLIITRPTNLGFEAIIDGDVFGMIFRSDVLFRLERGDQVVGYIKDIREDGKVDLALQPVGETAKKDLSAQIIAHLKANGGTSTITDKSAPDTIFSEYGVSKKAYKRALGALYRAQKIQLSKAQITLARERT